MTDGGEQLEVLVIGGGSAGLAVSHELNRHGVDHLVLEQGRIGQSWRDRWDSFCLVTPNWSVQLPDGAYDGTDPDGFMPRDEIVAFLERYASRSTLPIREGVAVQSLQSPPAGGFIAETTAGDVHARHVVVATGAYQRPHRPAGSDSLPDDLAQIDLHGYRHPDALP
ncbi:MAG: NAD(P)-binding domain-containing protein, partial [Candidatus Limnocylindria bacterium]